MTSPHIDPSVMPGFKILATSRVENGNKDGMEENLFACDDK